MVDISKKKGNKDRSDSEGDTAGTESAGTKTQTGGGSPQPYSPSDDEVADPNDGQIADISKEWAEAGDNLNYSAKGGESEKEYVKRQVAETKEFYEDYVDTALDNMSNMEEFTMVHHALMLSCAQNRIGIKEVLMDEFNYSENAAIKQTDKIVRKAGEPDAFSKVTHELTEKIVKE